MFSANHMHPIIYTHLPSWVFGSLGLQEILNLTFIETQLGKRKLEYCQMGYNEECHD